MKQHYSLFYVCVQAQKQEMVLNLEEHKKEASAVMASTNEALTVHKIETVKSLETWKNGNGTTETEIRKYGTKDVIKPAVTSLLEVL